MIILTCVRRWEVLSLESPKQIRRMSRKEGTLSELLVSGHDNAATSSCLGSILFNIVFTAGDDKVHLFIKTDKKKVLLILQSSFQAQ